MIADQIILQEASKVILKSLENGMNIPNSLLENWITALIFVHHSGNKLDSDTVTLCNYLRNQYAYPLKHGEGFDLGAVYGSLLFSNCYRKIVQDKNGE